MKLSKKKTKDMNKGVENTSFQKEFEVLNYTPVEYRYTDQYKDFFSSVEKRFKESMDKIPVDDLSYDICDRYIESVVRQMKVSAREQYINHLYVITHYRGLLSGEMSRAQGHLENLKQDLKEIENQINTYLALKQERKIL